MNSKGALPPRRSLFSDPDDFYALHPQTAEMIDTAADQLSRAHGMQGTELAETLYAAESCTLKANAAFAEYLGADPRALLPLVRLVVDASAHHNGCALAQAEVVAGGGAG